ncbi:flagellar brake domain-containing protein [Thalassotalea sp. PLHSN55]|uniref:flagellar brake domain-containing protein n=1 Tax=Thalassotalea sp. PLHSN55 TaxID=3435888 RepID=UPI003F824EE8
MSAKSSQIEMAERLNRNLGLLQAGSKVTIDITTPAGQKSKHRTTFIGYLPKQYILIQYPDSSKLGNFGQYLKQGAGVTVRGLIEGHEGAVVAFVSTIMQTLQIPSRIIVLSFPQSVILQSLRSSMRIDTDIVTKVKVGNEYWQASMMDVSVSGCQVFIGEGEKLVLASDKKIELVIEDFQGLSNLNLTAELCNNKQVANGISLGLKFLPESKEAVVKLMHHAVTYEGTETS